MAQKPKIPSVRFPTIPKLDAAFKSWRQALEWSCNVSVAYPLQLSETPEGPVISYGGKLRKKVQLTSAGGTAGSYNWSEVYETASGGFAAYPSPATGLAWEYNLNASVTIPSYTVIEWFGGTGEWRFQMGSC